MKMNLFHRTAVNLGLRLGNEPVNRLGVHPNLLRKPEAVDQLADGAVSRVSVLMGVGMVMIMQMFMMMVFVTVVMVMMMFTALLLSVDPDRNAGAADAASLGGQCFHDSSGNPGFVHLAEETLLIRQKLQQCGGQHIPRRAHGTFQIQCFQRHRSFPSGSAPPLFMKLCA